MIIEGLSLVLIVISCGILGMWLGILVSTCQMEIYRDSRRTRTQVHLVGAVMMILALIACIFFTNQGDIPLQAGLCLGAFCGSFALTQIVSPWIN